MSLLNLFAKKPTWSLQSEGGVVVVNFDVFIGMEFRGVNSVATEPIEEGGFAAYNKQETPKELAVTLAATKPYDEQQHTLNMLEGLAHKLEKISLITPSAEYKNLNLEGYTYARKDDNGAGMLVVDLKLVEIREVEVKKTVTASQKPPKSAGKQNKPITKEQAKNPSNASTAKTGKTQAAQPQRRQSMLKKMGNGIRGVFSRV